MPDVSKRKITGVHASLIREDTKLWDRVEPYVKLGREYLHFTFESGEIPGFTAYWRINCTFEEEGYDYLRVSTISPDEILNALRISRKSQKLRKEILRYHL